jgi:hypothetical protein
LQSQVSLFFLISLAPGNIGPGSYSKKQYQPKKENNTAKPQWGNEARFKSIDQQNAQTSSSPAPGSYNDLNKWNKRTFNLKFLNI